MAGGVHPDRSSPTDFYETIEIMDGLPVENIPLNSVQNPEVSDPEFVAALLVGAGTTSDDSSTVAG